MFNLYSELLLNEALYSGTDYSGTWTNSYSFAYLQGTTVYVNAVPTWTLPDGTEIKLFAGESLATMFELDPFFDTPVLFVSSSTGSVPLYVKVEMYSNLYATTPVLDRLQLTIKQKISLYTIATQVLEDALDPVNGEYFIDPWLQNISVPYSFSNPVKHRTAMERISEACGGTVFQDRDGIVRIESTLYARGTVPVDTITQDRIIDSTTPVSDIYNRVQITTQPYARDTSQTVWELIGDDVINAGQSRTFEVFFTDWDAVLDVAASLTSVPSGATITSETWYTWGGRITVLGSANGQVLTLSATGEAIIIRGARVIVQDDSESIRKNGLRTLALEDNGLIQDAAIAETIAASIVSKTATERRDVELQWRGDPTFELGDLVTADGATGTVVENQLRFNGALSSTTKLRRE